MHEIKFRVWNQKTFSYGNDVEFPYLICQYGKLHEAYGCSDCPSFREVNTSFCVEQFTGLLDKNNEPIYEGDLISFQVYNPHFSEVEAITNAEVWFDQECLSWQFGRFKNSTGWDYSYDMTSRIVKGSFEVTGNIH